MTFRKTDPPEAAQLPTDPPEAGHLPAERPERRPKPDNALPEPEPPILEGYPDKGDGLAVVTLIGLLEEPTSYRVGKPIPQDLAVGGEIFNLSDRAAGVYNFRHK